MLRVRKGASSILLVTPSDGTETRAPGATKDPNAPTEFSRVQSADSCTHRTRRPASELPHMYTQRRLSATAHAPEGRIAASMYPQETCSRDSQWPIIYRLLPCTPNIDVASDGIPRGSHRCESAGVGINGHPGPWDRLLGRSQKHRDINRKAFMVKMEVRRGLSCTAEAIGDELGG